MSSLVWFQLILWLRRDKKARLNKIEDIRDILRNQKMGRVKIPDGGQARCSRHNS